MADEGIMALPQGMGMQGEQPQGQQPTVTSADSYDAAQTALGRVNPGEQAALKEALRQNIGNLQLTPQQLDALIQVFEYVSQHPGDYVNLLQKMLEAGVLDEGDMPPEYDPEFIGAMLAVLNEMQQMQAAGAQEPMDLSPVVQGLQPMGMASGGLADIGQYLASKGRGGDSMLAHITPEEAAMLKRRGGSGTINPNTGLPEFKGGVLGGVFDAIGGALKGVADVAKDLLQSPVGRILGTVALATVLGPAGVGLSMGMAGGLAGAGVSLLGGGSVKEALISGAMGYIGGGGTIMGVNPVAAVGGYLPGAAGSALNTGLATGVIGAGIGKLGGMSTEDALKMGLTSGVSAGALRAIGADDYAIKSKMLALHEAGDPSALPLYDTGNVANMKAYIDAKSAPVSTAPTGPIGTAVENLPFSRSGIASDADMASLSQRYSPATDAQMARLTSAGGNAGPGLKMPPMGSSMSYDPAIANFRTDYGLYNPPASEFPAGLVPPTTGVRGMGDATGAGVRLSPEFTSTDFARGVGGTGGGTNYSFRPVPTSTTAPPTGFMDRMVTGAENIYDTYLSPDRPGLPSDAGIFRKYGPLAAAGTATIAAFGGMDPIPAEIDPITAGERARYEESRLRAKARRDRMAQGGYGLEGNRPSSYITPAAAPLIYGADGKLIGMAQGGYIGRFNEGGDVDERRRLAQERRAGQVLEGNQVSAALARARAGTGGILPPVTIGGGDGGNDSIAPRDTTQDAADAETMAEIVGILNGLTTTGADISGGQFAGNTAYGGGSGLGSGGAQGAHALAGGIASLGGGQLSAIDNAYAGIISDAKMEAAAMKAADAARFGPITAMPASIQAAQDATNLAAIADANLGGYGYGGNTGDFLGGSDSFGEGQYAKGGPARITQFPRRDGPINGRGTGTSDDIPAMLSDGEFVFTAKAVRNAGGGSRRKGAARMYKLMKKLEGGAVKGN